MAKKSNQLWKSPAFWTTLVTSACVAGLALGIVAGNRTLNWYAGSYRNQAVRVAFDWPVYPGTLPGPDGVKRTWVPRQIQEQLIAKAEGELNGNPLDAEVLAKTAGVLRETGWFARVNSVRREDGGVVVISGEWREPAAVVRVHGVDRLISAAGELLPVDYPSGTSKLRFVTGVSQPAPVAFGEVWMGGDVQAGLELLAYLQTTPIYSQVAGVDVAEYVNKKRLTLVTDAGNKVVWGAAPSDQAFAEPRPTEKLEWLLSLKAGSEYGKRIDANRPLVDVTNPRGIMVDQSMVAGPEIEIPETPIEPEPRPTPKPTAKKRVANVR